MDVKLVFTCVYLHLQHCYSVKILCCCPSLYHCYTCPHWTWSLHFLLERGSPISPHWYWHWPHWREAVSRPALQEDWYAFPRSLAFPPHPFWSSTSAGESFLLLKGVFPEGVGQGPYYPPGSCLHLTFFSLPNTSVSGLTHHSIMTVVLKAKKSTTNDKNYTDNFNRDCSVFCCV